jgi:di/tricarboxylate transporter
LSIWRGHEAILAPPPDEIIHAGDMLLIMGRQDRVSQLLGWGVMLGRNGGGQISHQYNVDLTEVLIPPRSHVMGKTLQELRFRDRYGLTSVALWRNGRSYRTDVGKFKLEEGDALLMVGSPRKIEALAQDADYMVLKSSHARRPRHPEKAIIALLLFAAAIILSILETAPTAPLMLTAAVGMILAGCLSADEAYRAVEWRVVFLIAGMLSLTAAMTNTGLDALIGGVLTNTFAPFGDLFFVAAIFLLTMFVTQITTGQVASLVMGPIVIAAALQVGINSHAVAVATATACATAFMTPIAHPVNALIMSPGGYQPRDFLRIGIPMTLLVFGVLMFGMIVFWGVR